MADRVEPKPAQLPLPGGQEGAVVRLHPLLCGEATWPDAWPHRRGGPLTKLRALGFRESRNDWVPIPLVAFLVEHPGFGPFLIDTGLDPSVAEDPRENLGRLVSATGAKTVEMKPEQVAKWKNDLWEEAEPHVAGEELVAVAPFRRGGGTASYAASKASDAARSSACATSTSAAGWRSSSRDASRGSSATRTCTWLSWAS